MRKILLAAIAAGAALTVTAPAEARQGCGVSQHRGPGGYCRVDRGRMVTPVVRVGVYYPGRGYWGGHHYYHHRYRHHGGWRYR